MKLLQLVNTQSIFCAMFVIFFVAILISSALLNNEVMQSFSYSFGLKMIECGEKINYTREMARDILHFWEHSYSLTHEELGCLVLCALVRLELLDQQGNLAVENAKGFIVANGGDDSMVMFLIDLYNGCRHDTMTITDGCKAALELAKCFRGAIGDKNLIPNISSLLVIPHD